MFDEIVKRYKSFPDSSTVITGAFLRKESGIFVFDFFPVELGQGKLKEDVNSDLQIKCSKVFYEVVARG